MKKLLGFMPALLLFAAIAAPNASADELVDPATIKTKTGGALTLGDGVLTDTATLDGGGVGAFPGTFTFVLTAPNGALVGVSPTSGIQPVGANGVPVMVESSVPPTLPGTYEWEVTFKGADGTTAKITETQVVMQTPEPSIGALMLVGIGFLLVARKRCASGLTPTS